MNFMLINAKYEKELLLSKKAVEECSKHKTIALYTSAQFVDQIEKVVKQLEENNVNVLTSQPDRTQKNYQLLGCDTEWRNLQLKEDVDAFLYVGDGMFHPTALLLAQRNRKEAKEVIIYNPIEDKTKTISANDIKKILKKYKGGMIKFMAAENVGVMISTKPGQRQHKQAKLLEAKYPEKRFYYFVDNKISFDQLENFPFVECWINTACPRIAFEDSAEIRKPIINLNDALHSEEEMSEESVFTKA